MFFHGAFSPVNLEGDWAFRVESFRVSGPSF